jgi:hypothetical protein
MVIDVRCLDSRTPIHTVLCYAAPEFVRESLWRSFTVDRRYTAVSASPPGSSPTLRLPTGTVESRTMRAALRRCGPTIL